MMFASRLEQYRPVLVLLARALLGMQRLPDGSASDLAQITLLEAHRDRENFRGQTEEEFFAWLRRMLHHNVLDACEAARTAKREIAREALEADLGVSHAGLDELLVAPNTPPDERAARNEELIRLAEALERLPHEQREAVSLKDITGLSLRETADRLGRSPAAVAGLLYRGRLRLHEMLQEG